MFQELAVRISLSEIRKSIRLLKNGKSNGPDLSLNEFIIYGNDDLLQYLHGLFNKIFDIGYFPDSWGEGGGVTSLFHYIRKAALSIVSKLFSNILNTRLNDWAEK